MTFSKLMLYWPTVFWTMVPPSLENLSSCATRSTPVDGCLSPEYDLMLSGMAVCSPRLSRKTYLQGVAVGKLQSGTMWMPVVLTARIGVFRLSARGCTPTAELDSVGPRRAISWSCWIIVCACCDDCALSEASSRTSSEIWAPLTPSEPLICSTASTMPSRLWGPYTPPAPVIDSRAPNLMVL